MVDIELKLQKSGLHVQAPDLLAMSSAGTDQRTTVLPFTSQSSMEKNTQLRPINPLSPAPIST